MFSLYFEYCNFSYALLKFELIQAFMVFLVTCKNAEDLSKMEALECLWIFFRRSRAVNSACPDRIGPNFELIRYFMDVLLTCKNEEDLIKNEGARVHED